MSALKEFFTDLIFGRLSFTTVGTMAFNYFFQFIRTFLKEGIELN